MGPLTSMVARCLPLLLATLALAAPAAAQVVEGRIVEAEGGAPAGGVSVVLTDLEGLVLARDETDADGGFALRSAEPGEFLVLASALGYRPVRGGIFEVGAGGRIEIEIRLEVDPVGMDELAVEVDPETRLAGRHPLIVNGFTERASSGRGRFLTPQDLERMQHLDVPRLLQQTGRFEILNGSAGRVLGMRRGGSLCEPLFIVDDLPLTRGAQTWLSLDQSELLGVEVYRSATEAPIEFQRYDFTDCGVVVVWTRR